MCGIAGIINYQGCNLSNLLKSLEHRGPDIQSYRCYSNLALLHTRLSIQDIQHGNQPFEFGPFAIIFNGEIYNHKALRKEIPVVKFVTNSDTETLLHLYIKYKEKMFEMIDGMYAFCIFDQSKRQLFLARDRAGKKPLYFYKSRQSFFFASELNALKSITKLTPNYDAIQCYLRAGFIWQPDTAYENVYELPAGTFMYVDVDSLAITHKKYFDMLTLYQNQTQTCSEKEALSALDAKLTESVSDRLAASDVEVGVFLSGGIDSNLIAAIASKLRPNIKTFTVKFSGSYDESGLARLTAQQYHTEHHEVTVANLCDAIPKIICNYGEPFMDSSAIPSYYVAKEASKFVKVVLSGDGADELFGGYRRYVATSNWLLKAVGHLGPLSSLIPQPKNKQSIYNYLYRLLIMGRKKGSNPLGYYLSSTTDIFEDVYEFSNSEVIERLAAAVEKVFSTPVSSLRKMLLIDFQAILFCDLLVKMDIASMANSLEVRSPFLGKALLEWVPTLPDTFKVKRWTTKYLLRKLAKNYLPRELINQPKRGFEVPLRSWVDKEMADSIHDELSGNSFVSGFLDPKFCQDLLASRIKVSHEKRAKMLWTMYCLELWYQNDKNYRIS